MKEDKTSLVRPTRLRQVTIKRELKKYENQIGGPIFSIWWTEIKAAKTWSARAMGAQEPDAHQLGSDREVKAGGSRDR